MKRTKTSVVAAILVGFLLAAGCAMMTSDAAGEGIVLSRGCYSAPGVSSGTSWTYGFRSWYADSAGTDGRYGLVNPNGTFRYATVVAFGGNSDPVTVTRYKHRGNGTMSVVAKDYFGPGGGFADYVEFDSISISKTAGDTISIKMCW